MFKLFVITPLYNEGTWRNCLSSSKAHRCNSQDGPSVHTHYTGPISGTQRTHPSSTYKHSNGHHFLSHLILLRMIDVGVECFLCQVRCWWLLWIIVRLSCWFSAWCFLSQQFRISFLLLLCESSWISFSVEAANNLDGRSELLSRPLHNWSYCSWIEESCGRVNVCIFRSLIIQISLSFSLFHRGICVDGCRGCLNITYFAGIEGIYAWLSEGSCYIFRTESLGEGPSSEPCNVTGCDGYSWIGMHVGPTLPVVKCLQWPKNSYVQWLCKGAGVRRQHEEDDISFFCACSQCQGQVTFMAII